MMYRIDVLGPIPRDEIMSHAGAELKKYKPLGPSGLPQGLFPLDGLGCWHFP